MRRRLAAYAKSKRNPWRFCVANLWGLRGQSFAEGIFKIGSTVGVVLTRKRYPKRAPKRSSALPIKSSVRDALKSIQSRYNQPPEKEPRQPGATHSAGAFFCPGRNCATGAVASDILQPNPNTRPRIFNLRSPPVDSPATNHNPKKRHRLGRVGTESRRMRRADLKS